MSADERVYLLGEDVLDPYGGAFKVTRGLSTAFPGRVITTPVSEAGIAGIAAGLALRGLRPVIEIMFGDFLTLIADQLINHLAKFRWMYNDQVRVPVVIRTPMGGRRSYGPTHSQSLEKLFLGIPGLRVLAPNAISTGASSAPGDLLYHAILENEDPVLFVEHKLLYQLPVQTTADLEEFILLPNSLAIRGENSRLPPAAHTLTLRGAPLPVLTIAAYGYMAEQARQAALRLAYEQELFTELVVLGQLAPLEISPILASVQRTRRLLVVEEGSQTLGWGAEVVARTFETLGQALRCARRLGALDLPIPASPVLESAVLPDVDDILQAARKMV